MNEPCPFCLENNLLRVKIMYQDKLWYITEMQEGSIENATMAVTMRHIATPFEISEEEWTALKQIISKMKGKSKQQYFLGLLEKDLAANADLFKNL